MILIVYYWRMSRSATIAIKWITKYVVVDHSFSFWLSLFCWHKYPHPTSLPINFLEVFPPHLLQHYFPSIFPITEFRRNAVHLYGRFTLVDSSIYSICAAFSRDRNKYECKRFKCFLQLRADIDLLTLFYYQWFNLIFTPSSFKTIKCRTFGIVKIFSSAKNPKDVPVGKGFDSSKIKLIAFDI